MEQAGQHLGLVTHPTATGGTRLVTRIHAQYDRRHPLAAMSAVLLMEFDDFVMLRGRKARAESGRHSAGVQAS